MNQEIIKPGIIRKISEKLRGKRIVIGGNKEFYKSKYHLMYSEEIINNVLTAFLNSIEEIVEDGDSIKLNGYFTIKPVYRKTRYGRNVYTNTEVVVPEKYRLKFNPGTKLADACDRFNEKVKENADDE